ncbi:MAG TPA: galactonate dehydratase [Opitutaceae bacterium]|jgi:galactonate dehydratase
MKISGFELFQVAPRWLFLKISTDAGISGWGEPIVEGKAATVRAAVTELMAQVAGKDPLNIEDHWNALYRGGFYRGGPILMSAIAGIDQALWDIKGRHHGAPVHQLLGGRVRERVRVYTWIGGDRPADVAAEARAAVAKGFTAVKMNATSELQFVQSHGAIDAAAARVASVREAVGPDFGIGVDFHGRVHKPMARQLAKELEPLRPMFIEEPVLPENNEALRELAAATSIPIATGERMYSRWDFKRLLADGYVDIIQPDVSHAGGITECRKILSMAEAYDVAAAPHCPLGPIALAASLQLDAVSYNAFIQEQSHGIHYNKGADLLDYLANPEVFRFTAGFVEVPAGPGLGIEINEAAVRRAAASPHDWKNPAWRHPDGSVAEW